MAKTGTQMKSNGLTAKQEAYCVARASGLTGTEAFRKAFPASTANAGTARKEASKLDSKPLVKMRIHDLMQPAKQAAAEQVTATLVRVLTENAAIAFSDIRNIVTPEGRLKRLEELDEITARSIASVKVRQVHVTGTSDPPEYDDVVEYKFWDKGSAIDRYMRHLGGYEKDKAAPPSPFDGLPRDVLKQIAEAIRKHVSGTGPVVAEQSRKG